LVNKMVRCRIRNREIQPRVVGQRKSRSSSFGCIESGRWHNNHQQSLACSFPM
jgi:hypothetical protein